MTSSAALSHLFSQGSVSAKLLRKYEHYQDYVKKFYKNYYHDTYNDNITPTFVYAIATEKPGDLLDNLFFFSLINLDYHIELIKDHGFKISLSKIEIL